MKIRGLLAAVLVSCVLAGCSRTATAPEVSETSVIAPSFDGTTTPPPDTTANRGGGALGNGH